jgi:hypothetical protein
MIVTDLLQFREELVKFELMIQSIVAGIELGGRIYC